MKYLIKFIIFTISLNIYSQATTLENNTWYLEKLVLNQNDYLVPNGFQDDYTTQFTSTGEFYFHSPCTPAYVEAVVNHVNNQEFSLQFVGVSLQVCPTMPGVDVYDELFADDYIDYNGSVNNNFNYTFTNQDNIIILTITNVNGDQAIYQNQPLSTININELTDIRLYPNPVKEQLHLKSELSIEKANLYDITGKLIKTYHTNQLSQPIDMSSLHSGVYFITLYSETGKQTTKKLIVE